MPHTICFPDYTHSILGIPNSVLKYYGAKTDYPSLPILDQELSKKYKNVIIWILDGLGVDLLNHTLSSRAFLRQFVVDEISSVFPPTTTAATTTYYSGLPPAVHGWVGWSPYFKKHNRCIELFTGRDNYTQEQTDLDAQKVLPYTHIFKRIKKGITCTEVFPQSIRPHGVNTFSEACEKILVQSKLAGPQFILAYWPEPDHCCHHTGTFSDEAKSYIKMMNAEIRKLSEKLTDTLLVISADHGHVPVQKYLYIDDYPELTDCMIAPLTLDDRTSAIFLKPGMQETFQAAFHKHLSSDFILLKSADALKNGLFGPGPIAAAVPDFLGDFLIIAIGEKVLHQRIKENVSHEPFKSCHAGLNKREMIVPLIFIRT